MQIFNTIRAANRNATYQQLCTLLSAQFEPVQQQQLHEVELSARVKAQDETQPAFAAALQSLAARASPGQQGNVVDRIVLQQFIEGQTSPEVRLQLSANRPAYLDGAIQQAIKCNCISNGSYAICEQAATCTCSSNCPC